MDKGHWREKQGEHAECFRKDLMSKYEDGTCLVVQWLRRHIPNAGARVQSLVRELDPECHLKDQRSHMLQLRLDIAK